MQSPAVGAAAVPGSCSLGLGTLGIQPGAGALSLAAQDHPVGNVV